MKKYILGVKIDDVSLEQASKIIEGWLEGRGKHYIVTPNPEFILTAQKDPQFRKILNDADLSIPDGAGLKFTGDIENTTPGTDLMEELCKLSSEKGFATGFLGGRDQVAKKTVERLLQKYPKLQVTFADQDKLLKSPKLPKTDLLFVAFGHPKQEKWIAENLNKLDVKVAMGVGGAFDFLSGKVPRAPVWIRNLGFEWLFRLTVEPWRIRRQIKLLKYLWLLAS